MCIHMVLLGVLTAPGEQYGYYANVQIWKLRHRAVFFYFILICLRSHSYYVESELEPMQSGSVTCALNYYLYS